ncbi:MAG: hypothetical protein LBJ12_09790 [Oscillospiraceae bacterium]|jgi:hypothetical protein|nr:hypothetical protein [Oscillospiraceae bacterium]
MKKASGGLPEAFLYAAYMRFSDKFGLLTGRLRLALFNLFDLLWGFEPVLW